MRVAILGAGAIGSTLGALLARGGQDVTLVARGDHVAAIRENGLQVDGALGSFTATVAASTGLDFTPDLVLLAAKTQDVEAAVRAHRDRLQGVPLVTMQNGVRSDEMVRGLLPPALLLSAVVLVTATYLTPGHVTVVELGHLVLGRPNGPRDGLVSRVAAALGPAVPTSISDNLPGAHWLKLLMNLNNAIPALTNRPLRDAVRNPFLRKLSVLLMKEGMTVTQTAGIRLAPLDGVSVRAVRMLTRLPSPLATRVFAARAGDIGGAWPVLGSTLQSLRRGRPTEIEYLNGEIVRRGQELGIPTPRNGRIVDLVHGVERTGRFFLPEELRDAFASTRAG